MSIYTLYITLRLLTGLFFMKKVPNFLQTIDLGYKNSENILFEHMREYNTIYRRLNF